MRMDHLLIADKQNRANKIKKLQLINQGPIRYAETVKLAVWPE